MYVCCYGVLHAHTNIQYDLNDDGVLEFILTTTDAELVFIQSDNTLLHGETIKVRLLWVP